MNALDMLHDDHRHIKQLLKNLVELPPGNTAAQVGLVDRLGFDLDLHAKLEEDVFYPALSEATAGQHEDARFEAVEEHRLIEKALTDLMAAAGNDDAFAGRAKVLKELVEHHVHEEDKDLFPLARSVMDEAALNRLGHRMSVRRAELFAKIGDEAEAQAAAEEGQGIGQALGHLEDRVLDTAGALMKEPARVIGRGVEEVVRGGTHLAGEILSGVRKGLTEGRRETQDSTGHS